MNGKPIILIILFSLLTMAASPAIGEERLISQKSQKIQTAINKALETFVFVGSGGSGVIISSDGYIVTNDHVAGGRARWRVRTTDGALHYANLIGTDPYGDIALLKIPNATGLTFMELADSDALQTGQTVLAIGNPFTLGNLDERPTVTLGIISALHRSHYNYTDAIMTDAPINPGNSGGPLVTLSGELAGINGQINSRFQTRTNSGIGYAITSNQIKRFLPILKKLNGNFTHHGWLPGIRFLPVSRRDRRPYIRWITKGSQAYQAGLRKGDIITQVDGKEVGTYSKFAGLIKSYPANTLVKLTLQRQQRTVPINVVLERHPIIGPAHLEISFYPSHYFSTSSNRTLKVASVTKETPAAKAGVQEGDIIVSIAGRKIPPAKPRLLHRAFQAYRQAPNGLWVELTVIRNNQEMVLPLAITPQANSLGVQLSTADASLATQRDIPTRYQQAAQELTILQVEPNMFADRAGLQKGDVILQLDGQPLRSRKQYERLLQRYRPGMKVSLQVWRMGKILNLPVTLGLDRDYYFQ